MNNKKHVTFNSIAEEFCGVRFDVKTEEISFNPTFINTPQLTFLIVRFNKFFDNGPMLFPEFDCLSGNIKESSKGIEISSLKFKDTSNGSEILKSEFAYFVDTLKKEACSYNRYVKKNNLNKNDYPLFDSITIITASKKDNYNNKTTLEFNDLQKPVTLFDDSICVGISKTKLLVDGKEIKLYF